MADKIRIQTNAASPALGTYSQAIRTGDLVFVTGQTGRDPETGKLEKKTGSPNAPSTRQH